MFPPNLNFAISILTALVLSFLVIIFLVSYEERCEESQIIKYWCITFLGCKNQTHIKVVSVDKDLLSEHNKKGEHGFDCLKLKLEGSSGISFGYKAVLKLQQYPLRPLDDLPILLFPQQAEHIASCSSNLTSAVTVTPKSCLLPTVTVPSDTVNLFLHLCLWFCAAFSLAWLLLNISCLCICRLWAPSFTCVPFSVITSHRQEGSECVPVRSQDGTMLSSRTLPWQRLGHGYAHKQWPYNFLWFALLWPGWWWCVLKDYWHLRALQSSLFLECQKIQNCISSSIPNNYIDTWCKEKNKWCFHSLF